MVSQKEIKWVLIFSGLVILITTLPYALGFANQGKDWVFTGFVFGVEDGNSYIAKMLSGAHGAWLFKTPYSILDQKGFLAFLPYILSGKLTSAPGQHEQLVGLFQLYRWGGIIGLSLVSYYFIALYLEPVYLRKLALVISMVGGGLGWIMLAFSPNMPLELYSPETFGFLSVFGLPHLLISKALLLLGLYGFIQWKPGKRTFLAIALIWFMLGFFQPLTIVIGWLVLAAHLGVWGITLLYKKEKLFEGAWLASCLQFIGIVGLSSLWVIYNFASFLGDSYLKGWYAQNIILSPDLTSYLASFGILLPLAVWGALKIFKNGQPKGYLLAAWLIIFLGLVYIPSNVQRRMAEGFWTAFIILCGLALVDKITPRKWLLELISLPFFMGSVILLSGGLMVVMHPAAPVFVARPEVNAFQFLDNKTPASTIVLAAYETSNPLPAWSLHTVALGHGPESVNLALYREKVGRFFQTSDPDQQLMLLNELQATYVFYGPDEQKLSARGWTPAPFLNNVYEKDGYAIYQFTGAR